MTRFHRFSNRALRRPLAGRAAAILTMGAIGAAIMSVPQTAWAQEAVPTVAAVTAPGQGYTRALKGADGQISGVQTAIRLFTPSQSDAPTVYLVAVTHIGEKSYYQEMQKLLDKQDLVLFEGVRPGKAERTKAIPVQKADSEKAHTLQKRLSDDLGVQFQLDGIQYGRANFRNSDLSWDDLMAAAQKAGAGSSAQLTALEATMSGGSGPEAGATGGMINKMLGMIEQSPAMAQTFRRVLITTLADPDALKRMTAVAMPTSGAPGGKAVAPSSSITETILIEARNKAILEDFKAARARLRPGASVALLYGAGHMSDMEHRLETELGYRPTETQWLTALTIAAKPTATPATPATPAAAPVKVAPAKIAPPLASPVGG